MHKLPLWNPPATDRTHFELLRQIGYDEYIRLVEEPLRGDHGPMMLRLHEARAQKQVALADHHQAELDRQKAALAEIERLEAEFLENGYSEPEPREVCGADCTVLALPSLADFALVRGTIRHDAPSLRYEARHCHQSYGHEWPDAGPLDERRHYHFVEVARHWIIAEDTGARGLVPMGLRGAALESWAREWRDAVSGLKGSELFVYAQPGQHVAFTAWADKPVGLDGAAAWCRSLEPPRGGDDPRFMPVFGEGRRTWTVPCEGFFLAGAYATAEPATALDRAQSTTKGTRLVTGIAALDGLYRGGVGMPLMTRMLVTGDPSNCKTQFLLEAAVSAAAAGWHVLWLSLDDPDLALVDIRRLQRMGLDDVRAGELRPEDVAQLSPHVEVVNGVPLEAAWEAAAARATAAGRPLLVLFDSLQATGAVSHAAEGKGPGQASIEATIGAIIQCQIQWPAAFIGTSEITANGTSKGTRDLEYKFDVRLRLRLSGEALTLEVQKGKPCRPGAVGTRIALAVDFDGQRLLDPTAAAKAKAGAELRAQIVAAVEAQGGLASGAKIEAHVQAKGDRVRAEIKAMVADGALLKMPKGYRLP
ncbi:MAG TPA: hypothetical protein VHP33_03250 [Polyangiaceae bacterium]|nr:hypothetical protein [Polyangiaceae bacterium]